MITPFGKIAYGRKTTLDNLINSKYSEATVEGKKPYTNIGIYGLSVTAKSEGKNPLLNASSLLSCINSPMLNKYEGKIPIFIAINKIMPLKVNGNYDITGSAPLANLKINQWFLTNAAKAQTRGRFIKTFVNLKTHYYLDAINSKAQIAANAPNIIV
jgi:hypothetical protein